ncbi:MAG: tRNA (adenosine(37)-N6)-threonylcarbamoyltransferase complex dimerization subunit type 1 TsaB [Candidatus Jidaibacter sp.]|jgi:tRNA threonylcarbamoyladenosine biosynthesis protein TsaB|nr:tRNA (adenosine(37)-N6)-threonylcarbamoyltransferase complex dimerization subunit type 1 TsaB [Candidatus Jidaibacter sp.]
MTTLIIDTCFGYLSIALAADDKILQHVEVESLNQQSKLLASSVDEIMQKSNENISTVVITKGPGSFTGIRIGLAFALGLQAAINCKIFTISSLATLNMNYIGENIVTIKSGLGTYFSQKFHNHTEVGAIQALTEQEIDNLSLNGNKIIGHYKDLTLKPSPEIMLKLFKAGACTKDLTPLYAKDSYF